jgi:hypothetical protein
MNLLGVADANCCLTLIDVGAHGREKDSVLGGFGKAFISVDLKVPPMRNFPGTSISIPLYFVEDEVFLLKPHLMRLFPRRELDFAITIFSGQHSSTGRTIECALGLLTKTFGIFQKAFETNVEVTECTFKSACFVYSCIRKHKQLKVNEGRKKYWNKNSKISLLQLNTPLALDALPLKQYRCESS